MNSVGFVLKMPHHTVQLQDPAEPNKDVVNDLELVDHAYLKCRSKVHSLVLFFSTV